MFIRIVLPTLVALIAPFPVEAQMAAQQPPPHAQKLLSRKGWSLELGGMLQLTGALALKDAATPMSTAMLLRRARTDLRLKGPSAWSGRLHADFGNGKVSLLDAWIGRALTPSLMIQAGRFKSPFSQERLTSSANLTFDDYAVDTALGPDRDVGVMATWRPLTPLQMEVALMNGTPPGSSGDSDGNRNREWAFRASLRPLRRTQVSELILGVALTMSHEHTSPLPALRSPMRTPFLSPDASNSRSGRPLRLCPQLSGSKRPLLPQAEAIWMHHERLPEPDALKHRSWLCSCTCVLRGGRRDTAGFHSVPGAWGLEWITRLHGIHLDKRSLEPNPTGAPRMNCLESGLLVHPADNLHLGVSFCHTRYSNPITSLTEKETGLRLQMLAQF